MTAAVARHRRPRPVGRQLDLIRQVLQRLGPERQLPRQRAGAVVLIAQHRLLPQRVVGVLHRQRRQPRRHALRVAPGTTPPGPAPADRATSRRRRCGAARSAERARHRHVAASASSNRCARSGSSRDRSKPRPAAAVSAAGRLASSTEPISSRGRADSGDRISCRGTPSRSGNTVRRLSCRSTRSPSASSSAARSSARCSRTASGIT